MFVFSIESFQNVVYSSFILIVNMPFILSLPLSPPARAVAIARTMFIAEMQ